MKTSASRMFDEFNRRYWRARLPRFRVIRRDLGNHYPGLCDNKGTEAMERVQKHLKKEAEIRKGVPLKREKPLDMSFLEPQCRLLTGHQEAG